MKEKDRGRKRKIEIGRERDDPHYHSSLSPNQQRNSHQGIRFLCFCFLANRWCRSSQTIGSLPSSEEGRNRSSLMQDRILEFDLLKIKKFRSSILRQMLECLLTFMNW